MREPTEKKYDYLFSVIMPVYKTEEYVEESIQCLLGQTIGFEDNIQLILVNNATPDDAGAICQRYQAEYPNNIVYVHLEENRGPGGARNAGLERVKGKYVGFLDSDDKWEPDAFAIAAEFLREHGDQVGFTICRKHYFDAWDGRFYDDDFFFETRVCSIWTDARRAQFWLCAGFFRAEALEGRRFDEQAKFSEDMKFLSEMLMRYPRYGVIREAEFCYRKRQTETSQVNNQQKDPYWYSEVFDRSYQYIVDRSVEMYGYVIPYIQYVILQELTWRIWKQELPVELTREQTEDYKDRMSRLLQQMDDYAIQTAPYLWKEYRLFLLKLKYGEDIYRQFECRDGKLFFHDLSWCYFDDASILTLVEHHVQDGCVCFDGKINMPFPREFYEVYAKDGQGREYPLEEYPGDDSNIKLSMGEPCLVKRCVRVRVPLEGETKISFWLRWGKVERKLKLNFGKFAKLTKQLKRASYCVDGGYIFRWSGRTIQAEPLTRWKHVKRELRLWQMLLKQKNLRALLLRMSRPVVRLLLGKKQLWVVIDRPLRAWDNGEYFFRYLHDHPQKNVRAYFSLSRQSADYGRMKKYGKTADIFGLKHQMLFLAADKLITATWDAAVMNPFGDDRPLVRDLFRYEHIYLDHALTKDDISFDFNNHSQHIAMWTTGSQMETDSVRRFPYGFAPSVPQTTGLARYDAIWPAASQAPKKQILLAPTWRKSLVRKFEHDGTTQSIAEFKESDFFLFYNDLMNDERLLACMRSRGYRGAFKLHPLIMDRAEDFTYNDVFTLQPAAEAYEEEFFDNALVVTDYSSIAMDFAFADRPAVYAQFDKEEFYRTHSYHASYFDYEKDGFGPVCYDYESTVQALIDMIGRDCAMDETYAARRKRFFAHLDDKNCQRICQLLTGGTEAEKGARTK